MHNPTKVIYEGDAETAKSFMGEAHTLLNKVRGVATAAGVGLFSKTARIADGVLVTALYTSGQSVIHIIARPGATKTEETDVQTRRRPSFYSGVVKGGTLKAVSVNPPPASDWDFGESAAGTTRIDLSSYKPTPRWRAQYNTKAEKQNKANAGVPGYIPLPHMGEGYQPNSHLSVDAPQWHDIFPQSDERTVPSQYYKITPSCYSGHMKKLVQYVLGLGRLDGDELAGDDPLADDVKQHGFQMRYDFRWYSTHGLTQGVDKRWWLVEISTDRGVLAMPLPLYEDYETEETTVLGNEQEEMATITQAFGGQPTGGSFPTGAALDEAIKRGDVLRLLAAEDMAEFYAYSAYSTCHGWAFSSDGREAHNTAHSIENYSDGRPIGVGVHYRLMINIGAINKERKEDEPIATATATLARISRGYLCRPGKKYGAQYHTPEPLLEGGAVVTYEFLQRPSYPKCDTTVGVLFIGKSLKLIRFYYNPTFLPGHRSGSAPSGCGWYSGSYAWTDYGPGGNVPTQFYTTDYDYREKTAPTMSEHTHVGALGGYSGHLVTDWLDKLEYAYVSRQRRTTVRTYSTNYGDSTHIAHIACPYGAREAYVIYYAKMWQSSWSVRTYDASSLYDPNVGVTFRWFYGYPVDPITQKREKPPGCWDDSTRRGKGSAYILKDDCGHLADSGRWFGTCQVAYEGGAGFGDSGSHSATEPKSGGFAESYLVANTEFITYRLNAPLGDAERWSTKSPDEFGLVKHFDCVFSALGEQHAVFNQRISTAPNDYVTFGSLHDKTDAYFFSYLGVL